MEKQEQPFRREFRVGPFSVGDLIALASIVFLGGANWVRIEQTAVAQRQLEEKVGRLEDKLTDNYVRTDQYREDIREIKQLLRDLANRDGATDHPRAVLTP